MSSENNSLFSASDSDKLEPITKLENSSDVKTKLEHCLDRVIAGSGKVLPVDMFRHLVVLTVTADQYEAKTKKVLQDVWTSLKKSDPSLSSTREAYEIDSQANVVDEMLTLREEIRKFRYKPRNSDEDQCDDLTLHIAHVSAVRSVSKALVSQVGALFLGHSDTSGPAFDGTEFAGRLRSEGCSRNDMRFSGKLGTGDWAGAADALSRAFNSGGLNRSEDLAFKHSFIDKSKDLEDPNTDWFASRWETAQEQLEAKYASVGKMVCLRSLTSHHPSVGQVTHCPAC